MPTYLWEWALPATIPYRGNVIVARVAASHKIAPKGRSYKIARRAAAHMIAPKGRSNRVARVAASHSLVAGYSGFP